MSACEKGKRWEGCLGLLGGMVRQLLARIVVSWNAAISACEKGTHSTGALWLLPEMAYRVYLLFFPPFFFPPFPSPPPPRPPPFLLLLVPPLLHYTT